MALGIGKADFPTVRLLSNQGGLMQVYGLAGPVSCDGIVHMVHAFRRGTLKVERLTCPSHSKCTAVCACQQRRCCGAGAGTCSPRVQRIRQYISHPRPPHRPAALFVSNMTMPGLISPIQTRKAGWHRIILRRRLKIWRGALMLSPALHSPRLAGPGHALHHARQMDVGADAAGTWAPYPAVLTGTGAADIGQLRRHGGVLSLAMLVAAVNVCAWVRGGCVIAVQELCGGHVHVPDDTEWFG